MIGLKIVSGGQTGVDQGALEAAVELGLDYGGWAPHEWLAEGGIVPERFRGKMQESSAESSNAKSYRKRTKANVRDSDATLIVVDRLPLEGGSERTHEYAVNIGKPNFIANISSPEALSDTITWLESTIGGTVPFVLNVAGPRESKAPGLQHRACEFLIKLLKEMA